MSKNTREILSTFRIEGTVWRIIETHRFFIKRSVEVEEIDYRIEKDGKTFHNGNGPNYESETEAEINILMQYID